MIVIRAKTPGFRRCGIAHSVEPTQWPDDRFTAEELKVLQAETELLVELVKDKPGKPEAKEAKS